MSIGECPCRKQKVTIENTFYFHNNTVYSLNSSVTHNNTSTPSFQFDSIDSALVDLKAGRPLVVVDDENRENEGDVICAAQFATPDNINFMAVNARGLICLALSGERLDRLELPLMVSKNTDNNQTAFTVSIDAVNGVSTGISAEDRARTIQVAIHPDTKPQDLRRPGHIFPLRAIALITMCQLRRSGLTFYLEKGLR